MLGKEKAVADRVTLVKEVRDAEGNLLSDFYTMATGQDGKIYFIGIIGRGPAEEYLLVYDPTRPWNPGRRAEDNPRPLGCPVPGERGNHNSLVTASDGTIYAGTCYSQLHIFGYDPGKPWTINRSWAQPGTGPDSNPFDLGPAVAGSKNWMMIHSMTIDRHDILYGSVYPTEEFFICDPHTGQMRTKLVGVHSHMLTCGQDGRIYGGEQGYLYIYDPSEETAICKPIWPAVEEFAKAEAQTIEVEAKEKHYVEVHPPTAPPGAEALIVGSIGTGPDGRIYFGIGYRDLPHLFVYDPETDQIVHEGAMLAPGVDKFGGRFSGMAIGLDGRVYGGSGTCVWVWDLKTEKPTQLGGPYWRDEQESNFHAGTVGLDGTVYLGQRGGASTYLVVIDPKG